PTASTPMCMAMSSPCMASSSPVSLPGWRNPYSFNVADIAIFLGALGLVLLPPEKKPEPRKRRAPAEIRMVAIAAEHAHQQGEALARRGDGARMERRGQRPGIDHRAEGTASEGPKGE
ncbi:hypothetical protein VB636_15825, partial [Paracoccus sp. APAP_BH8]